MVLYLERDAATGGERSRAASSSEPAAPRGGGGRWGDTIWSSVCKISHREAVSHARLPMVMGGGKKKNQTKITTKKI